MMVAGLRWFTERLPGVKTDVFRQLVYYLIDLSSTENLDISILWAGECVSYRKQSIVRSASTISLVGKVYRRLSP